MLEAFIQELALEMEVGETLPMEVPGVYVLPLDEDMKVLITAIPEGYFLSCVIAPFPAMNREKFVTQAMLGNLFGQGTHGGVLGLSENGNLVKLTKVVFSTVDYRGFRDVVEDFINTIDYWRAEALAQK